MEGIERAWGWGEIERVGGREGNVERGKENGRGKKGGRVRDRERRGHGTKKHVALGGPFVLGTGLRTLGMSEHSPGPATA